MSMEFAAQLSLGVRCVDKSPLNLPTLFRGTGKRKRPQITMSNAPY